MGNSESQVSRPSSQHRSSSNDVVQATAVLNGTTRVGVIQQQASFRGRASMSIPRPPLGEIKLSDTRTTPPNPTPTQAPPARPHQSQSPRPSWQRAPPSSLAPPHPAITVTQATDTSDRKSKWHGNPAVDAVRLVAAGMVRIRSKDSTKSTKNAESKPLLSQASPQTPVKPASPVAPSSPKLQPSAPPSLPVAGPSPPPAVQIASPSVPETKDAMPTNPSTLATVKEDDRDSTKELWKPVVAQIDEKAALMSAEDTKSPKADAVPEQSSSATEHDDVISVEDALKQAMSDDEVPLQTAEVSTVDVTPSTDIVGPSPALAPETTAPVQEGLSVPAASRSTTFDNRNVEDSQYPRSFSPAEDPSQPLLPKRITPTYLDTRPFFDDPFSGELLPSPYAGDDSPSNSSGHTVATPSPRSHTRDITLVADAEDPGFDSFVNRKAGDSPDAEATAPIPIPITFAPASLPNVHLFDEIMSEHRIPEVQINDNDLVGYSSAPPAVAAIAETLAVDTAMPRSPSADPYALRNIQQHSPLPRRATMSGWHMTPVRSRSPVASSQPMSPTPAAAGDVMALTSDEAIPSVDTFEIEEDPVGPAGPSKKATTPLFVPTSPSLTEGCYQLRNIQNTKAMDLSGDNNKSVLSWEFHGSSNQLWNLSRLGKGFSLTSIANERSLTIEESLGNGATIVASDYPVAWRIEPVDHAKEGVFRIYWPSRNLVMGLKEGSHHVCLWEDGEIDVDSQLWQLLRREDPPSSSHLESPVPSQEVSTMVVKTTVERDGRILDQLEHRPNTTRDTALKGQLSEQVWNEITTTTTTTVTTVTTARRATRG